ncbi:helix-turn-helix domain-containing protein [Phenylobacterium aquaticum]|uniref:helix-turn-helix domain-containing protein n=1 Tax=Phenylobacterium aquaticum TaxID=1763816 RepID=UPI001F5D64D6|nr:helix-turn-helix transcriptional regulator [Phenylobacterium aquaticum]MCI3131995.1 helix-turn-helix domain-containing protein [Phenylobacterium aquaticum]
MSIQPVGLHLRQWRQKRRMSQLDLACEAEISTRHLSFIETGRSTPSRLMILKLAEQLDVPVRERNVLLVSGGFAPMFPERGLDDPALAAARWAIDAVLAAQKPYPAFAIDRGWTLLANNGALPQMYEGVAPHLLEGKVNGLRLTLHPEGLARKIENLGEWRAHLLGRLQRQIDLTADRGLSDLMAELKTYPAPAAGRSAPSDALMAPLRLRIGGERLSFYSTTMVFGSPVDVTLSEIAVESFIPADAHTIACVRNLPPG